MLVAATATPNMLLMRGSSSTLITVESVLGPLLWLANTLRLLWAHRPRRLQAPPHKTPATAPTAI
eukprot:scaffold19194_cov38-Tisochrysis_lutea.AAC.2